MKYPVTIAAIALMAVGLMAGSSFAGIVGSAHDFSGVGWSKGEICLPCHTPHNATVKDASGTVLGGPLWNHALSTATYTTYDETGASKSVALDTNSILCMSCHDGTVSLDSFGGKRKDFRRKPS